MRILLVGQTVGITRELRDAIKLLDGSPHIIDADNISKAGQLARAYRGVHLMIVDDRLQSSTVQDFVRWFRGEPSCNGVVVVVSTDEGKYAEYLQIGCDYVVTDLESVITKLQQVFSSTNRQSEGVPVSELLGSLVGRRSGAAVQSRSQAGPIMALAIALIVLLMVLAHNAQYLHH